MTHKYQQELEYKINGQWPISKDRSMTNEQARNAVGLVILEHIIGHIAAEGGVMERLVQQVEMRPDGWLVGMRPCLPGRCLSWRDAHWLLGMVLHLEWS